ncbi:MAG: carboxylating nicotinate-nucleotide diphosphorylase [Spirochaetales bacterium]|nr:carboxylating nicotinate-nucleotide diphosphorylase [Spirochaetales bacterium]
MEIDECFEALLDMAVKEDLGTTGDVTSKAIFSAETTRALLYSKDCGVLAGTGFFTRVFARLDPSVIVTFKKADGDNLVHGDLVAEIEGKAVSILSAERISLNFLGYLSGIASAANRMVTVAGSRTTILDTRKTLPGYRALAKWAVRQGGASNHRMGLYDMVMIKDNHIDAAGGITGAVEKVRNMWGSSYRIEVECRNINEVREALECRVDIIMLDNMNTENVAAALALRSGEVTFEASGDMDEEKIKIYSGLGLDFISAGRLTHSVSSFNFSLQIGNGKR